MLSSYSISGESVLCGVPVAPLLCKVATLSLSSPYSVELFPRVATRSLVSPYSVELFPRAL
jgi:hypothetical protein